MQAILAVTLPFFALVLLGWIAARAHWLPESAVPGLNAYVLFFALPCMLFRFGAGLPLRELAEPRQLAVYVLSALAVIALTIAATVRRAGRADGVDLRDAAFGALVAAFPNAGFMGVPLLVALLGDAAAGPVIGAILVDLVVTSTICLAIAESSSHRAGAADRSLAAATAALAAQRAHQPAAVGDRPRRRLRGDEPRAAGAAGADRPHARRFGRAGRAVHDRHRALARRPACPHANAGAPLPAGGADQARRPSRAGVRDRLGGDRRSARRLTPFALTALTLTAALPSASNVSLLAERYGADNGRIARIIMASTVLAFATFSVLAWLFGAGRRA